MRVVLDTNIILSGLMVVPSLPATLLEAWLEGSFTLLTCEEQIGELRDVSRRPQVAARIRRRSIGTFINEMRNTADFLTDLPDVDASPDPWDNYLLALARDGKADFLVTGDKAGLLALGRFGTARIVTARQFLESF